jgi:hypothetical protein
MNMKMMTSGVLATNETVGDWEGSEEIAAEQFNRILFAIYFTAPDDSDKITMDNLKKDAWDYWGDNAELLELTNAQVTEYVESIEFQRDE